MTYQEKLNDTKVFLSTDIKEAEEKLPALEKAELKGIIKGMLIAQEAAKSREKAS